MRKRVVGRASEASGAPSGEPWLQLAAMASIEVTSEDPAFPIESALSAQEGAGWRASETGEQRISILFDHPVSLRRIHLRFDENELERTQEFTLRWSSPAGSPKEIVRQQWNFSPSGSSTEIEDYGVELKDVSVLELTIQPDIRGRGAVASLSSLRLA